MLSFACGEKRDAEYHAQFGLGGGGEASVCKENLAPEQCQHCERCGGGVVIITDSHQAEIATCSSAAMLSKSHIEVHSFVLL